MTVPVLSLWLTTVAFMLRYRGYTVALLQRYKGLICSFLSGKGDWYRIIDCGMGWIHDGYMVSSVRSEWSAWCR